MTQQFAVGVSTKTGDRLEYADKAAVHLSDGTLAFLYYDGNSLILAHSADHATVTTLFTFSSEFALTGSPATRVTLARDAADNLYVCGPSGNFTRVKAFVKGVGYTWTAQAALTGTTSVMSGTADHAGAVWCNTGGGTAGKGHLLLVAANGGSANSAYVICDAGAALAGAGTLVVNQGASPTFLGTTFVGASANMDLSSDGHGATSGLAVAASSSTALNVGRWVVSSAGVLSTSTLLGTLTTGALGATTKVRAVRYAAGGWAVVFPSTTSGRWMVARYSTSGQITAPVDSGAPAGMPLNSTTLGWDVFVDGTKLWVIASAPATNPTQQMYRQSAAVASGVTWATTATADDVLNPVVTAGNHVRAVRDPIGQKADWQVHVESASSSNRALYGDYTVLNQPPNAPTLATIPTFDRATVQRFGWTFSDPDAGDSQSKFDLQYRPTSGGAWTAVSGTTPNQFWDAPAATFAAGDYEWQVRTYDAQGAVGPWSASGFFTAAVAPEGATITAPTNGSTVATSQTLLAWSAPAQASYQVRKVADNAGAPNTSVVYYDSGEVVSTSARSRLLDFPVNNRYEHLQVRIKSGGLWSVWTSVRVLVSYTPPAVPLITNLPFSVAGTVAGLRYTVTNPAPGVGEPSVVYADIYRRIVGDTSEGIRIATNVIGSYDDYAVDGRRDYEVRAKAVGANGTSSWSAWTA